MTATADWAPSGEMRGLTDRPRMPRLGKLHLGLKDPARGFPRPVDHLVFPDEWKERVRAVFGTDKPREIEIVFPSDDLSQVAPVSRKMYSASRGKTCWGDSDHAVRMVDAAKIDVATQHEQREWDAALVSRDTTKVERVVIPCPGDECPFTQKDHCKAVINLQFLIPRLPGVGIWALDSGSINTILDVRGGIELVRKLSGGRLAGIPLVLRVEPREVIAPGDNRKKTVWTLKLFSMATLGRVLSSGERNLRELLMEDEEQRPRIALPDPREVPPPEEPEEDLFPAAAPEGSGSSTTTEVAKQEPPAVGPEVITKGGDPRPVQEEMAIAAEIEELFSKLETPPKERGVYRNAYRTRPERLRDMLKKTLAGKGGKK